MFKLVADYPSAEEETRILVEHGKNVATSTKLDAIRPVLAAEEVLELTSLTNDVYVAPQLFDYVVKIVRATRDFPRLAFGASPRAGLALVQGARVLAAFRIPRGYVIEYDKRLVRFVVRFSFSLFVFFRQFQRRLYF